MSTQEFICDALRTGVSYDSGGEYTLRPGIGAHAVLQRAMSLSAEDD